MKVAGKNRPGAAKKTTIYDLAQLTGASPSTVSAALNGTWRQRRIKESTVRQIQQAALKEGYRTNLQARGLRQSRSGIAGLIMPMYDNRFFASLAQSFEVEARQRGLCPITVSTHRDPEEEQRTVDTLISYAVDSLFVAGATDPDAVSRLCADAGVRHVNVDLPGKLAASVISDNRAGAMTLTEAMFDARPDSDAHLKGRIFFLGGREKDFATSERIAGFRSVVERRTGTCAAEQVVATGYNPEIVAKEAQKLFRDPATAPRALLVNSTIAFEGGLSFLASLPPETVERLVVGCYDYDPFVRYLRFPVIMMRQDVEGLIREAFRLLESDTTTPEVVRVTPTLVTPG
ncbi:LacI family DNA-binding transcriptional regulator [Pelagibius sp.]|uniref:LacI family DNA-binding transcriptional regulator n=1 Tax=Pelagibius sp. TaxID=1931238 RepID=UPI003B50AC26